MKTYKEKQKNPLKSLLPLVCSLLIFVTGCVRYDVGVNIDSPHQGAVTQTIKLSDSLTSFSRTEAQNWLQSIEKRSRQLGGRTRHLSDEEIVVTIPFSSGEELESKFNAFFNPEESANNTSSSDFVQLQSEMHLNQNNLLLLQRNRLNLTVDLRALGVLTTQGKVVVDPSSLLDLNFRLMTPWGARNVARSENAIPLEVIREKKQLVWHLQPGEINYLEAVFWMPSPLGIGTVAIALLILLGFYLKYKHFPWTPEAISPTPSPVSTINS